jgi:hypothetical protein
MEKKLKQVIEGQGFVCATIEEKQRIWQRLNDAGYPMCSYGNDKQFNHIYWACKMWVETTSGNITDLLNESDFFDEWTPQAGEWVESSNNDIAYENAQFCFEKDNLFYVTMPDQEIPSEINMTLKVHAVLYIRQIKHETMTLQEVKDKLREVLNKPNLVIEG